MEHNIWYYSSFKKYPIKIISHNSTIIIKIFYKVKNYNSLEEYKKYFKEFKENGYIQTDLSLRKFISNIKLLSKFSVIGPSYDIDSGMMGINTISCTLRFHPFLERKDIDLIIKNMPFFYQSMSSEKNFSIEIFGWFIIPRVYQKDVNRFLENLHHEGYLVDKYCFIYHSKSNRLNMNYYREFYKLGRIINPDHRQYKNIII